jgi:hypothetical protein
MGGRKGHAAVCKRSERCLDGIQVRRTHMNLSVALQRAETRLEGVDHALAPQAPVGKIASSSLNALASIYASTTLPDPRTDGSSKAISSMGAAGFEPATSRV